MSALVMWAQHSMGGASHGSVPDVRYSTDTTVQMGQTACALLEVYSIKGG